MSSSKKPAVSLRKPKPVVAPDPIATEAFVNGGGEEPAKASKRQDVKTSKRRMTIYLPETLAKKLAIYCVEQDKSVSETIEDFIAFGIGERQ